MELKLNENSEKRIGLLRCR